MTKTSDIVSVSVDFDYTVFNTGGFYSELPVEDYKLFKDTFEQVYHEYDGEIYTDATTGEVQEEALRDHARRLLEDAEYLPDDAAREISPVSHLADQIRAAYRTASEYLQEVELQELSEQYDVVIQTRQTHDGWQEHKVKISGAEQYASEVIVYDGEPDEAPKYDDRVRLLVDDTEEEHLALAEEEVSTVRIRRQYDDRDTGEEIVPVEAQTLYDIDEKARTLTGRGEHDNDR